MTVDQLIDACAKISVYCPSFKNGQVEASDLIDAVLSLQIALEAKGKRDLNKINKLLAEI